MAFPNLGQGPASTQLSLPRPKLGMGLPRAGLQAVGPKPKGKLPNPKLARMALLSGMKGC
jgi:hypothetical protein